MNNDKRPYLPIAPTITPESRGGFTPAMRRVQDNPDEHKRVYYAPDVCAVPRTDNPGADAAALKKELHRACVADIYIRYITGRNGNGCQILLRRYTPDGSYAYFRRLSSAGGFDFVAHLLHGVPLWLPPGYEKQVALPRAERERAEDEQPGAIGDEPRPRPPVILTDHCGLDGVAHPFDPTWRSLTLNSTELEQLGYVVL